MCIGTPCPSIRTRPRAASRLPSEGKRRLINAGKIAWTTCSSSRERYTCRYGGGERSVFFRWIVAEPAFRKDRTFAGAYAFDRPASRAPTASDLRSRSPPRHSLGALAGSRCSLPHSASGRLQKHSQRRCPPSLRWRPSSDRFGQYVSPSQSRWRHLFPPLALGGPVSRFVNGSGDHLPQCCWAVWRG